MEKLKLGLVTIHNEYCDVGGEKPINKEYPLYLHKHLFVKYVFERTTDYKNPQHTDRDIYNKLVVCAIVNVTKDFDPYSNDVIIVPNDTSSFQIRPKLIYKDKKGYFYKPHGKVVRLTDEETNQVNEFININKDE